LSDTASAVPGKLPAAQVRKEKAPTRGRGFFLLGDVVAREKGGIPISGPAGLDILY